MPQLKSIPINVFTSQICYDPHDKNRNNSTAISDPRERNLRILELMNKYSNQVVQVVNIRTNEVRNWLIVGWAGRVHISHLLFGDWRFAAPEDIARHNLESKQKAEVIAKAEAKRKAVASGLMFREMTEAAGAIQKFNEAAKVVEPPEPSKTVQEAVAAVFSGAAEPPKKKRGRKPKVVAPETVAATVSTA